jgi:Zn-dependent M28 family amino/carboxypeptidase
LLASDKVHSLPVTVAVNIAIRLAQKKQKVLLVDTDMERNAVAQVFDLDGLLMQKKVQPSCFENLSVCGVSADKLNKFLRKAEILSRFDTILLYTPNVPLVQPVREKGAVRPGVFFFVDDESTHAEQEAVEKLGFCSWLCLIPSLQSVLDLKRQAGA